MGRRDPAAFTEFVSARSGALFRTAYLLVGDHGLAQDLLQESLTRTYVAWPRLRDAANAEAYTRKVLTTTVVSWSRRRSWQERPGREAVGESLGESAGLPGPDLGTREWLWSELQQLPPRQRAAIVLRYYEDLSESRTAEAMGCSVGTVKSQVAAGLKKLRGRLGEPLPLTDEVTLP